MTVQVVRITLNKSFEIESEYKSSRALDKILKGKLNKYSVV